MSFDIGYPQQQGQGGIQAGTGAAGTVGGSLAGADAMVSTQTTDIITSTSADVTTPESNQQYNQRALQGRLQAKQIYATPCVWGDVMYWMDS